MLNKDFLVSFVKSYLPTIEWTNSSVYSNYINGKHYKVTVEEVVDDAEQP